MLEFRYRVVQLNRLNWREYARRENPVASALMAKMNIASADRPRVKLECIRLLASLRLNKAKMQVILGFVDTYLRLNEQEDEGYKAELEKLAPAEKESVMEVAMSWREQALREGLQEGMKVAASWREQALQEGMQQGMALLVTHLVGKHFGALDETFHGQIGRLDSEQLERLAEALPTFKSVEDLREWLRQV